MNTEARRRRAWKLGLWAELLCVWFLRCKGYRILARRFRTPVGELDIVARRGRVLAVVEVKARSSVALAADAVTARQRRRVADAAEWFLARNPDCQGLDVRFDAMLLGAAILPVHVTDAWRIGD